MKGSRVSRKIIPESSTTMEKALPRSVWKVMSPNPRVDMTVRVQYTPVSQEWCLPSASMMKWKRTL
ncbi:MAG: hypothetical protein A4E67_00023 [Syntrophaceae bacterium PtaB.Bin038]|nr:MAG: hypothetical protein A4E67_00023 [Syntrophaceae bacterium PtaB.Bin038]